MSLILEALRRSEAERRRGEAPDVLAPVELPRPMAKPGLPVPLRWGLAATVGALLLGVAWWQWGASPSAAGPADASRFADAVTDAQVAAPVREPAAANVATALPSPATAPPPVPAALPESPSLPASASASGPDPASVPSAAMARRADAALQTVASAEPPPPVARNADPVDPPVAPPPSSEFISPQATLRLADLTNEERAQLPALKISMHMWAPAATDRFVIIDGARLAEGDRVADATVTAILADGVTLAWRGRQLRLPIR